MIYAVSPDIYPSPDRYLEEICYHDENQFEWKIARIVNGFMVKYFGHPYFCDSTFDCELSDGTSIQIKNTGCIFFQDTDFDTFCHVRDILKTGYTDEIWECFEELFTERFEHDKGLIESEML